MQREPRQACVAHGACGCRSGWLSGAAAGEGNQRHYDGAAIRRLAFIRRCRDFGFTIEQVRELVDQPARDCVEVRDVAQARLDDVRKKLAGLRLLEAGLCGFVGSCSTACAGGPALDCSILEDLPLPATTTASCCP